MSQLIATTAIIISSYWVASLWECLTHAKILHASKSHRQCFKKLGWVGYMLRRANISHELIHHRATYQPSFYQQFHNHKHQSKLDNRITHYIGNEFTSKVKQNNYGLTVNHFWEMVIFLLVPLVANGLLFYIFDRLFMLDDLLIILVIFISALPLLMSKFVHPLLHTDYSYVNDKPQFIRACYQPLIFLQHYHYLHHTQKYCNFNLFLGADWILGYVHLEK